MRAGNLSERFDKTGGAGNVTDPRSQAENPNGGQTYLVTIFSGGNPDIKPEHADTFTAGAVFEPGFIPGLSFSADWYLIKIKGEITQLSVNVLASIVTSIVGAIGSVIQSAAVSLLYLDLRMRKEGLDLELVRFVEARQTGHELPDPYLPPAERAQPPAAAPGWPAA